MQRLVLLVVLASALGCSKKSRDDGPPRAGGADAGTGAVKASPRPSSGPLAACQGDRPPGNGNPNSGGDCKSDADCTAGKNGRCHHSPGGGPRMPWNGCSYDNCFADDDCAASQLCFCDRDHGNYCLASNCRNDGDCGSGGKCQTSPPMGCGGGRGGDFCRTPRDKCKTSQDCPHTGRGRTPACVFVEDSGLWECREFPDCPVG